MLTRQVRRQLVVFGALTAVVLAVMALNYVGLPKVLGVGRFELKAEFTDVSGLYPRANVTYRGTDVGQVTRIDLAPDGVTVVMQVDESADVPKDAEAHIHAASAIGEQYVELVADDAKAPYLAAGDTIPRTATAGMPQVAPLLDNLDSLLASVPKEKLTRTLEQIDVAFAGTGDDMQVLLEESSALLGTAQANLDPTLALIHDMEPFLRTQVEISPRTVSTMRDLAILSDALVRSDADLRGLIANGPGAATAVSGLTDSLAPTLPRLLANSTNLARLFDDYRPALQQTLVMAPPALAAFQRAYLNNEGLEGYGSFDFRLNVLDPPQCTQGYLPASEYRDPSDLKSIATPSGLYCKASSTDQRSVRGSRNFPCLEPGSVVERAASVQECRGEKPPPGANLVNEDATLEPGDGGSKPSPDHIGLGARTIEELLLPLHIHRRG